MRQRRRRPRGPRPYSPGPATAQSAGAPSPSGAAPQQLPLGQRPGRRRRRRGGNRPDNAAPPPYAGVNSGGRENNVPPRRDGSPRRRRGRERTGRNAGMERRGLDALRDVQQVGVALDPMERLLLELPPGKGTPPYGDRITGRAIDLIAPIGRGQRCLIVTPPKAGKTRILQCIAASVAFNHPDVLIYALLVDERPEEVTDFRRNTPAEVIAASSDMSVDEHVETAERAVETVAAQVLEGRDVLLLLDSITRLARAYNTVAEGSGRTLSGGLDAATMQAPRQIFGAARKIEGGGSLTIVGTELVERRIYPAIDIAKSGTRKEEKLYPVEIVPRLHLLRRGLAGMSSIEAMTKLLELLTKLKMNEEIFQLLKS